MSLGKRPSQILRELRAISTQPAEQDVGPMQLALRKEFVDNPMKFMDRLQKAEQAHSVGRTTYRNAGLNNAQRRAKYQSENPLPASKPEPPPPTDTGTEKCLEVAERLLKEWAT